jgi:hypothetical protein
MALLNFTNKTQNWTYVISICMDLTITTWDLYEYNLTNKYGALTFKNIDLANACTHIYIWLYTVYIYIDVWICRNMCVCASIWGSYYVISMGLTGVHHDKWWSKVMNNNNIKVWTNNNWDY